MSELTAQLDLPLGADAPAAARHAVTAVLFGWGFRDKEWLETAAVVVSELVTNAVRHGGGAVAFTVEAHEGRVVLCVADGSSVVPRRRVGDEDGGRGLAVIEALSACWGVADHQGGKQVWVELEPHPGPPVASHHGMGRDGKRVNIVQQDAGDGELRLILAGELDLATAPLLRARVEHAVTTARLRRVVIDLAQVSFCDSTGVGALAEARHIAARRGVVLLARNPRGLTQRVMEVTGLLAVLSGAKAA